MKLVICIDKENGMLFNGRRQSQDSVLRQKLLELVGDGQLWLNDYSAKQFETTDKLVVCEDFFAKAGADDFCFVENTDVPVALADELYIFKWNRLYPADKYFEHDLKGTFKKVRSEDFTGSSHKKITLEIYKRSSI